MNETIYCLIVHGMITNNNISQKAQNSIKKQMFCVKTTW